MIILPAIDLRGGQVVRLEQGRAEAQTTYGNDPVGQALDWEKQGAQELHVVDLDGAFTGIPQNLGIVKQICAALKVPVELGGGMRTEANVAEAIAAGVKRVVIGTKACESLDFIRTLVAQCGGDKIAIGIDAKDGKVATKGWTEASSWDAVDLARQVADLGVGLIIYTDIATDGMFTGPNYPSLRQLLGAVKIPIIASGGVATVEHIRLLRELPGLYGAIVGKALYDKRMTLTEIL